MSALAYLDTSALVKLVLEESESAALWKALPRWTDRASSVVAEVELPRAIRRVTEDEAVLTRCDEVLSGLYLIELASEIRERASSVAPAALRSLDAIHLASALSLGSDLDVFLAYDRRLLECAHDHGVAVMSPGSPFADELG